MKEVEIPLWFDKVKYTYKIVRCNGQLHYKCISTAKNQHEVVEQLVEMVKGCKDKFRIYCNDKIMTKVNYSLPKSKMRIYDNHECIYYIDIKEMSYALKLSPAMCYNYLRNGKRYVFIKN